MDTYIIYSILYTFSSPIRTEVIFHIRMEQCFLQAPFVSLLECSVFNYHIIHNFEGHHEGGRIHNNKKIKSNHTTTGTLESYTTSTSCLSLFHCHFCLSYKPCYRIFGSAPQEFPQPLLKHCLSNSSGSADKAKISS